MYKMKYTGFGYPTPKTICEEASRAGYTHYYWATESPQYEAMYNGDTVVVYDSLEGMPAPMRMDAEKYGEQIIL